jgi:hypothetical protein
MDKENNPHSFTGKEDERRKEKPFTQKASGRFQGTSPITKSGASKQGDTHDNSKVEEHEVEAKKSTTHAEKVNPQKAAQDPKIQALIKQKEKSSTSNEKKSRIDGKLGKATAPKSEEKGSPSKEPSLKAPKEESTKSRIAKKATIHKNEPVAETSKQVKEVNAKEGVNSQSKDTTKPKKSRVLEKLAKVSATIKNAVKSKSKSTPIKGK